MTISVECSCGRVLNVPSASAGKRIACGSCGAAVEVPETAVLEAPEDGLQEEARISSSRRRRTWKEAEASCVQGNRGWRSVETGLTVMYVSFLSLVCTVGGGLILAIAGALIDRRLAMPIIVVSILSVLALCVAIIVGKVMCCAVPESTGLRKLIIGSLIFMAAGVGLSVIFSLARAKTGGSSALPLLSTLVSTAGEFLFLLFIRGIGVHFRSKSVEKNAVNYMIFWGILTVLTAALPFIAAYTLATGTFLLMLGIAILTLAVAVFALFWYASLIRSCRDLVKRMLGDSRRARRFAGRVARVRANRGLAGAASKARAHA